MRPSKSSEANSVCPAGIGILGGVGPLASAALVQTIYDFHGEELEQHNPACVLLSDPGMPDRTEAILTGREDGVLAHLAAGLEALTGLGCRPIVIACMTLHHFLPRIPAALRLDVLSLVDVVISDLGSRSGRHLMLCTTGARRCRLFESHPGWRQVAPSVVFPEPDDQTRVHELIYGSLKRGDTGDALRRRVEALLEKYGSTSFVAGCTELHLLTRRLRAEGGAAAESAFVDPLFTVARSLGVSRANRHGYRDLLAMEPSA